MTELNKLVRKIDELDEINKINEIIDALNGGVSIIVDAELNEASTNPVQNATITSALSEKQDLLVAGTGLSLSGTTLNHLNTITSGSTGTSEASSGSTISIPYVEYDSTGHIISKGNRTHTVTGFLTSSDITEKADLSELSDVALTGDYADLINTPNIPETYSDVGAASENHSHTYSDVGALSASTSIPVVTDTYSSTSSDAMSGKAVKSAIDTAISSVYRPAGSVAFNNLPTPGASYEGNVYNLTEEFTTDNNFIEGSGKKYPAGTNVVVIKIDASTYKFDVLSGIVDLSNYQQINTAVTHTSGTSVGDETTPIYITSSGAVSELSYTIAKSVPSDAIFTDTTYTAGTGISISDQGVISNTQTSAEWGNIAGTLSEQTDLNTILNNKQDILTAGTGISISNNNIISVTIEGSSTPAGNYIYSTVSPALTPSNGICTWQITHNLDTSDVICSLYVNDVEVEKSVQINNDNTITVTFKSTESLLAEACKIVVVSNGGTSSAKIAVKQYLSTEIYNTNDIVLAVIDDEVSMYKSIVDNNVGNPLTDTTKWEVINLGGGGSGSRNIGEIVPSILPLTDASLHLLDGALITNSSIYSDFIDYIASLTTDYPDLFETEANWQTSVTTYGVCGKFVYDSTNNTVRLPKITGIVEGTTDMTALGDLVQAGLPNITGSFTIQCYRNNTEVVQGATGSLYHIGKNGIKQTWGTDYVTNATNVEGYDTGFDASRSSSIYDNSTTVQPQTIKILFYICITENIRTGYTRTSDLVIDKSSPLVALKNTDFDYTSTTAPETQKSMQYTIYDKNNNYSGAFYHAHDVGNNMTTGFTSTRNKNNVEIMANFGIGVNGDGIDFAYGSSGVKRTIESWSLPSTTIQYITIGASGATYTAPFDGYFGFNVQCNNTGTITIHNSSVNGNFAKQVHSIWASAWCADYIEVRKGDVCVLSYPSNLGFTAGYFYWIKKEGGN